MNTVLQACMITLMTVPIFGLAQVELMVAPTNATIGVAEPVTFEVATRNCGNSPVQGLFILSGQYDGFSIEVEKMNDRKSERFANAVMWEATKDDMMFQPVILKPNGKVTATYVLLYNVRTGRYVCDEPGKYRVHFRLRWSQTARDVVSAVAHVTVVGWDKTKEEDRRQLAALALWKDPEIAAFVQDKAELSGGALKKLEELKERYSDTLYGQLASDVLDRKQAP